MITEDDKQITVPAFIQSLFFCRHLKAQLASLLASIYITAIKISFIPMIAAMWLQYYNILYSPTTKFKASSFMITMAVINWITKIKPKTSFPQILDLVCDKLNQIVCHLSQYTMDSLRHKKRDVTINIGLNAVCKYRRQLTMEKSLRKTFTGLRNKLIPFTDWAHNAHSVLSEKS